MKTQQPTQPKYNKTIVNAFLPYQDKLKQVYNIDLTAKKYQR